jgi:hypothetical protein
MKTSEKHLVANNRIQLDTSTSTMIYEQGHHWDPTLILLLALGTPTWSPLQGSHVSYGDPSQLARPSPLRDGVPLFSAPWRPITNEMMCGSWSLSSSRVWSLGFLELSLLHCMTCTGLQGLVTRCLMNLSWKSCFQRQNPA